MEDGVTIGSMVMDTGAHNPMESLDHSVHADMNHSNMKHGVMGHRTMDHSMMNNSIPGSGGHYQHLVDTSHSMKVLAI